MSKCSVKILSKNEYMARLIVLIAKELDFQAWISTRADGNINVIDSSYKITGECDYSKSIYLFENGDSIPKGVGKLLVKPFSWKEMREALLDMYNLLYGDSQSRVMLVGHDLIYKGIAVSLTSKEADLFSYLKKKANMPVSREELLEKVWKVNPLENPANITDVYVNYLRQKTRKAFGINVISSVRGVGYMYTDKYIQTK